MKVKLISPAKTAPQSTHWRSIKYSLFPPLGLATLAGYLHEDDEVTLQDQHVERVTLDDDPDLVVIQVYATSAYRAYAIADHYRSQGAHVCLGGLHVTALPDEAARHGDTVFLGPGEDTWPRFLADFRAGCPGRVYVSRQRMLRGMPRPRRDLINRGRYLVPNSLVVSRGCPHRCDFCYKTTFFKGGRQFYTQPVDDALAEIERLPGRHLYFLDDNLFGRPAYAEALFAGLRGMGRVWQAAGTVQAVLQPGLVEKAAACGLRSLFVGFETLSDGNLREHRKLQNLTRGGEHPYERAILRLHDHGVMVNASFVFGMDEDDETVFDRTVEWAVRMGVETATFHILTPYPGTELHSRLTAQGRMLSHDWNRYDTRHAVFRPARVSAEALEAGHRRAYREFYRWPSIVRAAWAQPGSRERLRHVAYAGGWRKMEPMWDLAIRSGAMNSFRPLLEAVLDGFARHRRPAPSPRAAGGHGRCAAAVPHGAGVPRSA